MSRGRPWFRRMPVAAAWSRTSRAPDEREVLDRLAGLTARGVSPWDAAAAVFGGGASGRRSPRAGLSRLWAGGAGDSVPS